MKRLFILVVLLAALVTGCKSADLKVLEKNLQAGFAQTGQDIKVQVIELKNLKDILPGFAFVEIKIYNNNNLVNTERFITNGRYFAKDIIDSKTLSSLKDELDFEFPYCKKANALFKEKLADKSDYALYIVHLPLDMHPNAQIMAQIFEAGMQMGFNFKNELFEADYIKVIESKIEDLQEAGTQLNQETLAVLIDEVNNQIINDFAAKTDNPDKFKSLVLSDEIKTKVDETKELAENLNISATPAFYINGKAISGYNERLILKALDDIK